MYEAATKQLLMQKLLIDEFQYSTCCNKFRTFIIKSSIDMQHILHRNKKNLQSQA